MLTTQLNIEAPNTSIKERMELGKEIPIHDFTLWINSLRSGNYEQGKGKLERNGQFCCLGVACEVVIDDYQGMEQGMPSGSYDAPKWLRYINNEVQVFAGDALTRANDTMGATFDEIADTLEAIYVHQVLDFEVTPAPQKSCMDLEGKPFTADDIPF